MENSHLSNEMVGRAILCVFRGLLDIKAPYWAKSGGGGGVSVNSADIEELNKAEAFLTTVTRHRLHLFNYYLCYFGIFKLLYCCIELCCLYSRIYSLFSWFGLIHKW